MCTEQSYKNTADISGCQYTTYPSSLLKENIMFSQCFHLRTFASNKLLSFSVAVLAFMAPWANLTPPPKNGQEKNLKINLEQHI